MWYTYLLLDDAVCALPHIRVISRDTPRVASIGCPGPGLVHAPFTQVDQNRPPGAIDSLCPGTIHPAHRPPVVAVVDLREDKSWS